MNRSLSIGYCNKVIDFLQCKKKGGIVAARKEGKWTHYSISMAGCENVARLLRELTVVTVEENNYSEGCCE